MEQEQIFNAAEVLDTFMQNEEAVLALLDQFMERTQTQLDALPGLEKAGDWESARLEAHTIKGAAYTLGGTELGKAAARLELAYKENDMKETEAAFPSLLEAFGRYKKEAEEFIRSRK